MVRKATIVTQSVVVRLMLHRSSPPGALWALGFVTPAEAF